MMKANSLLCILSSKMCIYVKLFQYGQLFLRNIKLLIIIYNSD